MSLALLSWFACSTSFCNCLHLSIRISHNDLSPESRDISIVSEPDVLGVLRPEDLREAGHTDEFALVILAAVMTFRTVCLAFFVLSFSLRAFSLSSRSIFACF